ncbi:sugar-specific transcriptional regulator TrmB [Kitasatospora sp. MAP12-15]|uniref:helix-turn-helix transcriptional regulator n=1 Tax=unclassified Kitasatospora TaxID=2633591 RepID=UPI0024769514|nr:LuxR C-terminal-related transcriptional regulator [Kitasatospora sp. MAP12-44]MDH6110337.1 sugar-specific transcriptional regulator TrmB [Kitasatospora sp. MAP12-44]
MGTQAGKTDGSTQLPGSLPDVPAGVPAGLLAGARPADYPDPLKVVAEALAQLSRQALEQAVHAAAAAPVESPPGAAVVYLYSLPEINRTIQSTLDGAEREILTAQPDGPRPRAVLDDALESVRRQIAGGVAMRTLYQHTTRFDEATKDYVRTVTDYGVQVRTLAEFFDRLIVIDRATAFISANDDRTVAVMIKEPSVVRFLSDVFERSWDRAEPFPFVPIHAAGAAPEVVPSIRDAVRRLLVEGHSDKVIARRLGISERSLQAHVAHLKDGVGAKNRLHLGFLLGRSETVLVL